MSTALGVDSPSPRSRGINIALWVVQVLLAAVYGAAGYMKSTMPIAALAAMMKWPAFVPGGLVRFIGAAELAGAVGIVLPAALRVAPGLTTAAAAGLALIQILAIPFHLYHGESEMLPFNAVLLALALFVVWGRLRQPPVGSQAGAVS